MKNHKHLLIATFIFVIMLGFLYSCSEEASLYDNELEITPSLSMDSIPPTVAPQTGTSDKTALPSPLSTDSNEPLKQSSWFVSAVKGIKTEQYRFSKSGNTLSALNPVRNFQAQFNESGWHMGPQMREETREAISKLDRQAEDFEKRYTEILDSQYKESTPEWNFHLQFQGVGRIDAADGPSNDLQNFSPVSPKLGECDSTGRKGATKGCLRQLEYQYGSVTEFYRNLEKGIEHGYKIDQRPNGDGTYLVLESHFEGLKAHSNNGQSITFHDDHADRLIYKDLLVKDANGTILSAHMTVSGNKLRIVVDDTKALYPIEIDPLATSPSWQMEIDVEDAYYGYSVASAKDINADGYSDVIIGAPYFQSRTGKVFVYLGSASGLSSTADWEQAGYLGGSYFGCSVAGAGDVNGDGYGDIIVGARKYKSTLDEQGAAYLYLGSSSGPTTSYGFSRWAGIGEHANAEYGYSVAGAGDINNDGYDDIIVGSPYYTGDESNEGKVYVYLGSIGGPSMNPDWTRESNKASAVFGFSVASAGDVNNDAFDDVIIGSPGYAKENSAEGLAFVYHGSSSGLPTYSDWSVKGDQINALLGSSVAAAGDVNGDGYGDVIIGAPNFNKNDPFVPTMEGKALLYMGSESGLESTSAWSVIFDSTYARFGQSVASAGDVNGDNYADIIVGAPNYTNGSNIVGAAFLYLGSPDGPSTDPDWTNLSNNGGSQYGISVASAGDVNGDGLSDIIIGASQYDNGENNEGRAYLYMGVHDTLGSSANWKIKGDQEDAYFGHAVASAGDVNGDGYGDIMVTAINYNDGSILRSGKVFLYHGSESGPSTEADWSMGCKKHFGKFGYSIASAGDVNGDGYGDILIGAPNENGDIGSEGVAYLFLGSASGVETSPSWRAEGEQRLSNFGASVAGAGDVNGDGFADVIIGSPNYTKSNNYYDYDDGRAYLYFGSINGLSEDPDWFIDANSEQGESYLGTSVASAGDVNGDGFADIIIGAPYYKNEDYTNCGKVFVYLGSPEGPSTDADWTVEGYQDNDHYGQSVSSAGDVNGDGYSDVIIGVPGHNGAGWVHGYYGSDTGLSTQRNWGVGTSLDGTEYGNSVSAAGDINGDGYSDVIIGAKKMDSYYYVETGWVQIYLGSDTGLGIKSQWGKYGSIKGDFLGHSVASAGDVNGDGYADVIMGASGFGSDNDGYGTAYLFLGNGGNGISLLPRQGQSTKDMNIHPGGFSENETELTISMFQIGPIHTRVKLKMQVEIKPSNVPFDGSNLRSSSDWIDSSEPTSVPDKISMTISNLEPGVVYHWRSRLYYRNAGVSHWYVPQATGNGNSFHVRLPKCGNHLKEGLEECDSDGECCISNHCAVYSAGTACGDSTVTECSAADTCDGAGNCIANDITAGTHCGNEATECIDHDICDGAGNCIVNYFSAGTTCGDAGTECINQDTCDGMGTCTDNGFKPANTNCGDAGTECVNQDVCDGTGVCTDNGFKPADTNCGDTGTECINQDTCDGTGTCTDNGFKPADTNCGDTPSDCEEQDTCDGTGICADKGFKPADTVCGDTATDCEEQDTCNDSGVCTDRGFKPFDTACGEGPTACSGQDRCDNSGTCLPNHFDTTALCDDSNTCTYSDHCDGSGNCEGTIYNCEKDVCESASICDGLGGCNSTVADDGTYCDDESAGDERCYSGDCLTVSDGETCDKPVRLTINVAKEFTLDGMLNTYEPPETCSTYTLTGPEMFFDIELTPGSYKIEAIPDEKVDIALVLLESCNPPVCKESLNEGGQGEAEIFGPVEIGENESGTPFLFAVESQSITLAGSFSIAVKNIAPPDGDTDDVTDGDKDADEENAIADGDDDKDKEDDITDGDDNQWFPDGDADKDTDNDTVDQNSNGGVAIGGGCQSTHASGHFILLLLLIGLFNERRRKTHCNR